MEDNLYEDAKRLCLERGGVSISFLQRSLDIGYNRASLIVEEMEREGFCEPFNGKTMRKLRNMNIHESTMNNNTSDHLVHIIDGLNALGDLSDVHYIDIIIRRSGTNQRHEGDWIRLLKDMLNGNCVLMKASDLSGIADRYTDILNKVKYYINGTSELSKDEILKSIKDVTGE